MNSKLIYRMISLPQKRYFILSTLILLLIGVTISCSETTLSNTENEPELISKQISIQMLAGDQNQGQETRIDAIDILIFIRDTEGNQNYTFYSFPKPTLGTDGNVEPITQTITMKSGSSIDVHLFVNVHQELVDKGLLSENLAVDQVKKTFETLLHSDHRGLNNSTNALPMYGKYIDALKNSSTITIPITIVRGVAKVSVRSVEPTNFKLRELYVFYPAADGRIVPDESAMSLTAPGQYKITRPSLPLNVAEVADDDFVARIYDTDVSLIENLYIYENKIWPASGVDKTTSRVVVGGVLNGSSELTYFLVKSKTNSFSTFIRNHLYTANIGTIDSSGYPTALQAAHSGAVSDNILEIDVIITPDWGSGDMIDGGIDIN